MSVLDRTEPVVQAVRALLDTQLPVPVTTDEGTTTARQVVVEPVWGPNTTAVTAGGPDWADLGVQVTSIGEDRADARLIGDLVRETLAGKDRLGHLLHPLNAAGAHVDDVATAGDGHVAGTNPAAWAETFRIRYQKA